MANIPGFTPDNRSADKSRPDSGHFDDDDLDNRDLSIENLSSMRLELDVLRFKSLVDKDNETRRQQSRKSECVNAHFCLLTYICSISPNNNGR